MESASPENIKKVFTGLNGAGIGLGGQGVAFFDLGVTDVAAIVCSTNTLISGQKTYVC